jgi:hypothetical protein
MVWSPFVDRRHFGVQDNGRRCETTGYMVV